MKREIKRLIAGTALDQPLRQVYHHLTGNKKPPITEADLREARDNAYVRALLRSNLKVDSNCVDVGANEGFFLAQFMEFAPNGRHYAFEPIPSMAASLRQKFPGVEVRECALSDQEGRATFQYLPELPGWSGLRPQPLPQHVTAQPIQVDIRRLDDLLPTETIAFMKVDVEGAELEVLRGAQGILARCKPIVYFECGKFHHAYYATAPKQVFDLFTCCGMGVFLVDQTPLSEEQFTAAYESSYRQYDRKAWGNYLAM